MTRTEGDIQLEGSNASAEEMDEGMVIIHLYNYRVALTLAFRGFAT